MSKFITNSQLQNLAKEYDIELAAIKAVLEVESSGDGFDNNGYPSVLYEGHIFHRLTKGKFSKTHPHLSYPKWVKTYYNQNQIERINEAGELDNKAALMSASWGCMQVMGFNYKLVNYNTIEEFVVAMFESEYKQIKAGLDYIKNAGLLDELKTKSWRAFARGYNGPQYAVNNYHNKLKNAYIKHLK